MNEQVHRLSIEEQDVRIRDVDEKLVESLGRLDTLFRSANWFMIFLIGMLYVSDNVLLLLRQIQASERIITEKVILVLVGGTIVQTGVILAAVVAALTKRRKMT
jgi:hypothetical protein